VSLLPPLLLLLPGRAGHAGEAITFFTEADAPKLRSIAHLVKEAGSDVPDWMLHMAKQPRNRHRDRKVCVPFHVYWWFS
jgi:superfamily II DNA/RNA helicase